MRTVMVETFADWRQAARALIHDGVSPDEAAFCRRSNEQRRLLWDDAESPQEVRARRPAPSSFNTPKKFLQFARFAACHRDDGAWSLMYRVLWRLTHGEPRLLDDAADDDVRRFERLARAVSRDGHKMKAFVRFRRLDSPSGERYVAWHRPDHRVLRIVAPFFARRFTDMHWTIFTPHESAAWNGDELAFGPGIPAGVAPRQDALDDMWRTYYRSIFNPARIKLRAMQREMPVRYWPTLPETQILPEMLAEAPARVAAMVRHAAPAPRVADMLPTERDLASLAAAAASCQACDLCRRATQTVFGRGPASAPLMLVGEQPGDEEDRRGEPFVGPAGQILRQAVAEAGLAWNDLFLTNAVKHFHWQPRGKRRLHAKPPARATTACRDWLVAEAEAVRPRIVVCLGVTAARAVLGPDNRLHSRRGLLQPCELAPAALATWHPAAVLRAANLDHRRQLHSDLVTHLRLAAEAVEW